MTNSRRFFAVLAVILALTLIAAPITAGATSTNSSPAESEGKVEFTAGGSEGSGGYELHGVPSFDFGALAISPGLMTLPDNTASNFIKTEDSSGSGNGWRVTAKLNRFVLESSSTQTLPGATITLKFDANKITQRANANGDPLTPATGIAKPTIGASAALKLTSGGAANKVLFAPAKTSSVAQPGTGIWFAEVTATLELQGSLATAGAHVATINWSLDNVPT